MIRAAALLALGIATGSAGAGEHLLAGARLFRAERWAEALVEFRVAERLGDSAARGYAAATLVKLERPEQAVEEFEARGAPPPGRDPLLDYYRAVACHDARLYVRADRLLAGIGARTGPRIARLVADARAEIAAMLRGEPRRDAVEWYVARCEDLDRAGRRVLARAFCDEARGLGERRADRYGVREADAILAKLGPMAGAR